MDGHIEWEASYCRGIVYVSFYDSADKNRYVAQEVNALGERMGYDIAAHRKTNVYDGYEAYLFYNIKDCIHALTTLGLKGNMECLQRILAECEAVKQTFDTTPKAVATKGVQRGFSVLFHNTKLFDFLRHYSFFHYEAIVNEDAHEVHYTTLALWGDDESKNIAGAFQVERAAIFSEESLKQMDAAYANRLP
jgi:hypothetical protein